MAGVDDLERVQITSRKQWRSWLAANPDRTERVWLELYKKHCGDKHVPWADVVQEAICFGWIDCRTRRLDDDRMLLLVARRKPGSIWSALNRKHVAELTDAGLIHPQGQKLIDAARADGSWTFLDDIDALIVPEDLAAALGPLRPDWDASRPSDRKRALYHVKTAKRAPTRAARIAKIVGRLEEGQPPA